MFRKKADRSSTRRTNEQRREMKGTRKTVHWGDLPDSRVQTRARISTEKVRDLLIGREHCSEIKGTQ